NQLSRKLPSTIGRLGHFAAGVCKPERRFPLPPELKIDIHVPVIWGIRGAIRDVPLSMLSRDWQIEMGHGKRRIKKHNPNFLEHLLTAHEEISKWATTCSLNYDPEIPAELNYDSRLEDVCRPLLSIADNLGHGAEARTAPIKLCATRPPQDDSEQAL